MIIRYLTPLSNCRTDIHIGKMEIVYRQRGGIGDGVAGEREQRETEKGIEGEQWGRQGNGRKAKGIWERGAVDKNDDDNS